MPSDATTDGARSRDDRSRTTMLAGPAACCLPPSPGPTAAPRRVDFNRQIRPILSESCYQCHGPDRQQAQGRPAGSIAATACSDRPTARRSSCPASPTRASCSRGSPPTTPSSACRRPRAAGRSTPDQIDLIKRWIAEGAQWKGHWAYLPPTRPAVPAVPGQPAADERHRPVHPRPARRRAARAVAPEADRRTLIRRLSFDLIGLPPTPGRGRRLRERRHGPTPTSGWSTGCSPRPTSASGWRSSGSTWSGSPTPPAITATITSTSTSIATT